MTPRNELADLAIAAHDRLMQLLKSLSQQQDCARRREAEGE
jgi:hypothetical protein